MKHKQVLLEEMESYSIDIGLDPQLIHHARTKEQADILLETQESIPLYRQEYLHVRDATAKDHDPQRARKKAIKGIDDIVKYMPLYTEEKDVLMHELAKLKHTLTTKEYRRKIRYTPENALNSFRNTFSMLLELEGFSKTKINDDLLPVFIDMIKNPY